VSNLYEVAEADLSFTIEDKDNGFGKSIVLISPLDVRYGDDDELISMDTNIGFMIDPETGSLYKGETVEVNLRISTVLALIGSLPIQAESQEACWKLEVIYEPVSDDPLTFIIKEIRKDSKLGVLKMFLGNLEID
jgi:hypothetical protein